MIQETSYINIGKTKQLVSLGKQLFIGILHE